MALNGDGTTTFYNGRTNLVTIGPTGLTGSGSGLTGVPFAAVTGLGTAATMTSNTVYQVATNAALTAALNATNGLLTGSHITNATGFFYPPLNFVQIARWGFDSPSFAFSGVGATITNYAEAITNGSTAAFTVIPATGKIINAVAGFYKVELGGGSRSGTGPTGFGYQTNGFTVFGANDYINSIGGQAKEFSSAWLGYLQAGTTNSIILEEGSGSVTNYFLRIEQKF